MSLELPKMLAIDASEIRNCTLCKRGVMHDNNLVFYELTIQPCVLDVRNIQRMHGFEMMMGGAVGIARALSPDNTIARRVDQPTVHWICLECAATTPLPAMAYLENNDEPETRNHTGAGND